MNKFKYSYDTFISGSIIDLIVLNEKMIDSTNWYKWFNDEETTYHMQKHYFPNTHELQIKFFRNNLKDVSTLQLGLLVKTELILCGIVSLGEIDYYNRNANISLIIGEKKYRSLNIAHEAMKLIIRHAFDTLNLNKVCLGYLSTLAPWGEFLKNTFGFQEEGIQLEHAFKNGKYLDVINLGLNVKKYRKKVIKNG